MVYDDETIDPDAVPQAIRTTFELREPAPLRSLMNTPLDIVDGLDVLPVIEDRAYSLDGQTWQPYPELAGEKDDLDGIDFDDLEMFGVTVWADGRTEWPDDTVPDDTAEKLRRRPAGLYRGGERGDVGALRRTHAALLLRSGRRIRHPAAASEGHPA